MVGTAVNQVAFATSMSSSNVCAENRPRAGISTVPPDASVDSRAAISPWPWNNGITATVASSGSSR